MSGDWSKADSLPYTDSIPFRLSVNSTHLPETTAVSVQPPTASRSRQTTYVSAPTTSPTDPDTMGQSNAIEDSRHESESDKFYLQATVDSFIRKESYSKTYLVNGNIELSALWLVLVPPDKLSQAHKTLLGRVGAKLRMIPNDLKDVLAGECRRAILNYLSDAHPSLRNFFPPGFFSKDADPNAQGDTITVPQLKAEDVKRLEGLMASGLDGTWHYHWVLLVEVSMPYFDAVGDFYLEVSLLDPSNSKEAVYVAESDWGLAVTAKPGKA